MQYKGGTEENFKKWCAVIFRDRKYLASYSSKEEEAMRNESFWKLRATIAKVKYSINSWRSNTFLEETVKIVASGVDCPQQHSIPKGNEAMTTKFWKNVTL